MTPKKNPEEWLTFGLMQLMKSHRRLAEARLNALGLHTGQELVLLKLWSDGSATPTQLAEAIDVEPPTISKMLSRMEASNLIERRADPDDARVTRIYPSDYSRTLEGPVRALWSELNAVTTAGLSEAELALLRRMVAQMYSNIRSGTT